MRQRKDQPAAVGEHDQGLVHDPLLLVLAVAVGHAENQVLPLPGCLCFAPVAGRHEL